MPYVSTSSNLHYHPFLPENLLAIFSPFSSGQSITRTEVLPYAARLTRPLPNFILPYQNKYLIGNYYFRITVTHREVFGYVMRQVNPLFGSSEGFKVF